MKDIAIARRSRKRTPQMTDDIQWETPPPPLAPIRMGHGSTLTETTITYDPTYLQDKEGRAFLFITQTVAYRTRAGNALSRSVRDVLEFGDDDAMVSWIELAAATEATVSNQNHPEGKDQ